LKFKLYIDLIPKTSWYKNLRGVLSTSEWTKVRKKVYQKYDNKCSICHGRGNKHPVEAHERWEYDSLKQTQILTDIVALCPACHLVTHYGLALVQGKEMMAYKHLKKVNKCLDYEAEHLIEKGFSDWHARNKILWKVDMNWLLNEYSEYLSDITIKQLKEIK